VLVLDPRRPRSEPDLAAALREVRVLPSSGRDFGQASDLHESCAAGFVAKPYHLKSLAECVRVALATEEARV
jgi:hypothetical protein